MGTNSILRLRRSAAQLHALAQVEREIRATDPKIRCRYLREFTDAFRTYQSVLTAGELDALLAPADVVLLGDYHALSASQDYAGELLPRLRALTGRPVVLALEAIFVRHQPALDEWMRGEIEESELRERVRFDLDWGYDWAPYRDLLLRAREHALAVYGLDCTPRNDLRKIAARDRHAASKIAEIRERHPGAVVLVLFGESHLAPSHLPQSVQLRRPLDRVLTVLQNVDPLYWHAAGESCERVEAVKVNDDAICIFNSTPLEKYESYRICLERWRREGSERPDLAPSVYNLVDALLRFLNIDKYAATNGTQPRFLVDMLPDVISRESSEQIARVLQRKRVPEGEARRIVAAIEENGICYAPALSAILLRSFSIRHGAQEVARFVFHACQASLHRETAALPLSSEDRFYLAAMEEALVYLGSRVLDPARESVRESGLYALYTHPREVIEEQTIYSYRQFLEMVDFLVLHKDWEANYRRYRQVPSLIGVGLQYQGECFEYVTRQLGLMLGSQLYDAYVSGSAAKRFLRALFLRKMYRPGVARAAYFEAARRLRSTRRPAAA
ncbi:MAG TPA: ChaN family lipoprotein [Terriglobales bacterium]|nr:ChaN family lipoprotein [Terriglobales bacterium]